jgi:serine/threonine-protein kinase
MSVSGGVIADRYRLLRPLGSGASATVWAAADETLGRHVALKLLSGAAAADAVEREQLRREARALAALAHPRITVVFDYLETAGPDGTMQPLLVTELLEGRSLAARLQEGPLPWPEALGVCGQLADALGAAHRAGIVHRDVTPGNLMLTAAGIKLLDFGIAQGPADRGPTGGLAVGTPVCMAPEQLTGRGAEPASDLYALGCVLHWCLTGQPPYPDKDMAWLSHAHLHAAPPPLEIPGLPPGIVELYLACLAKDPSQRPTAEQSLQVLAPHMRGSAADASVADDPTELLPALVDVVPAPGRSAAKHAAGQVRIDRRRVLPAALVLAALGIVAALMLALVHGDPSGSASTAITTPVSPATATAATALASSTPSVVSVILPSTSTSASRSPTPAASTTPPLPDPATNPLGYLQSVSSQIQALIAQGPNTLQANAGHDLQNAVTDLENALASAQQNGGKKQWRDVRNKIAGVEQQLSDDAAAGQISQAAASLLTGELQQLANQVSNNSG